MKAVRQQDDRQWALNEMAKWLAHSKDFGEKPIEQYIIDERDVNWPWEKQPVKVFLIKYKLSQGLEGIGLAGPITWSFIGLDDLQVLTPEDLIYCYVGWYIQFFFINSKKFYQETAIQQAHQFANQLIKEKVFDSDYYQICDVLEVGNGLIYFAIETRINGKSVYLVGTDKDYIFYDKDLPQMQLSPLFYFLGKTFNPFRGL